jgi:hypothetical protein
MFLVMQDEVVIERICKALPHLEPEQVRAAVEWWREHPSDIQDQMSMDEKLLASVPAK